MYMSNCFALLTVSKQRDGADGFQHTTPAENAATKSTLETADITQKICWSVIFCPGRYSGKINYMGGYTADSSTVQC